jgi:hypothetical protein
MLVALCVTLSIAAAAADDSPKTMQFADVHDKTVNADLYFGSKLSGDPIKPEDTTQLIKQYGHQLQLALERWSVDHDLMAANPHLNSRNRISYYPYDLDNLVRSHYLDRDHLAPDSRGFYPNPVTSYNPSRWNGANVAPGDWSWDPIKAGNFSYVYHCNADGYVVGYDLYFYGENPEAGYDITGDGKSDGVVMHLASGSSSRDETYSYFWNGQQVATP